MASDSAVPPPDASPATLSFLDAMDQPIHIGDLKTYEVLFANQAMRRIFGEITGQACYRAIRDMAEPCPNCPNHAASREVTGKSCLWEYRSTRAGRWFQCFDSPVIWQDGRPARLHTMVDVTRQKQAEIALEQEQRFLADIFAGIQDGVTILDMEFNILRVNPAVEQRFPHAGPLVGRKCYEAYHGRDSACPACANPRTIQTGQTYCGVILENDASGQPIAWYDHHSFPLTNQDTGQIQGVISVTRDITAHVRDQQALQQTQLRFQRLFEDSAIGVELYDRSGQMIQCNRASLDIFGCPEEDAHRLSLFSYSNMTADVRRQLDQGQVVRMQVRCDFDRTRLQNLYRTSRTGVWNMEVVIDPVGTRTPHGDIGYLVQVSDITSQVASEQALRQSEQRYRWLFETMPQGVLYFDAQRRVINANPAAQRIMGMSLEAMFSQFAPEGTCRLVREDGSPFSDEERPAAVALRTGKPVRGVIMGIVNQRDQTHHWIIANAVPQFRPGESQPCGVYGCFEDITDRLRSEEQIRSLARFPDENPNVVGRISNDGVILYANPAGQPLLDHYHLAVGDRLSATNMATVLPLLRSGQHAEWELQAGDRTFSLLLGPAAESGYINVYGREVTQSKQAEQELRDSEEQYRHLFDNLTDAAFLADTQTGIILQTNLRGEALLGRSRSEIIGMHQSLLHPPAVREQSSQSFLTSSAKQEMASAESQILRKDGSIVPVRITSSPFVLRGRRLMMGLFHDMTELREKEQQLLTGATLAAIGRLAGGLAHDFNNILTVIQGYGHLLLHSIPAGDARRSDVEKILNAGERAAGLIRQLLALGRRQAIQPREVLLNHTIRSMESMLRRTLGPDIEMVLQPAEDLWPVQMDPTQVEQILLNLITNAHQAMPQGGRLEIRTENLLLAKDRPARAPLREAAIRCAELPEGPYVMFCVSDTGVGISPQDQGKIFEPYFTTKTAGTGLGLPTCYSIVKQNHGHIWCDSTPGKGSTFYVILPRGQANPAPRSEASGSKTDEK